LELIPFNKNYQSETIEKQLSEFVVNIIGKIVWNGSNV
jgi:phage repressor protein C with HTH and peptisase S24 domain